MSHVFISYARREPYWAAKIDADLTARGYATWRDTRNIDPDQDFTGEIEAGIRTASHIVVCLTPDVQRIDSYVRREIQYALNQDRRRRQRQPAARLPLIPLVLPGGELPVHISTWTALFLNHGADYDALLTELLDRLESAVAVEEIPNYTDPPDVVRYLHELHEWCSQQLLRSAAHLLSIGARTTPGLVEGAQGTTFRVGFSVSGATATDSASDTGIFTSLETAMGHQGKRLLLLGAPGSGKTTTLLAFARDAAVARLSDPSKLLPVLCSIPLWDCVSDLKSWIMRVSPWPDQDSGQPLFLLDSLDELGSERFVEPGNPDKGSYDPRERFLDALVRDLASSPVIVTCRDSDYRDIGRKAPLDAAITLVPLSDQQIRDYLLARRQAFLWERVGQDPEFAKLVRTPLLLGMLSVAIGDDASDLASHGAPIDEGFIFDRYLIRRFLHEAARPGELPFTESQTRNWLAIIATAMWIEPDIPGTLSGVWMALQQPSLARQRLALLFGSQAAPFLEFCTRMHLLRLTQEGAVAFVHLKLRDFCAMPALFQLAEWLQTGEPPPNENPLLLDVSAYPSEFDWTPVTHAISLAARDALSTIGRAGVDLIDGYQRINPASSSAAILERRRRYVSAPRIPIPDNQAQGIRDTIHIEETGRLSNISVYVNVNHSWVGDLEVTLHLPNGVVAMLYNREGGSRRYLDLRCSVLDSELAKLRDMPLQGDWTLGVSDHSSGDEGVLDSWELDIRYKP